MMPTLRCPGAVLAAAFLSVPALAQGVQVQFVDPGSASPLSGRPPSFRALELGAGGLLVGPARVAGPGVPGGLADVERVGSELWAAHADGVARLDRANFTLVAGVLSGVRARAIVPRANGALVFGTERTAPFDHVAVELDAAGVELSRTTTPIPVGDAIALPGGGYAAVVGNGVERLDAGFQPQGPFSPSAAALFTAAGRDFIIERIRYAGPGSNLVLVSVFGIARTDVAGNALGYQNSTDEFEGDLVYTDAGDMLVAGDRGLRLVDPIGGGAGTLVPHANGPIGTLPLLVGPEIDPSPSSTRVCQASVNSSGRRGALSYLGSDDLAETSGALFAKGLPAGQFCATFYGAGTAMTPFGNGTLCIDPAGGGLVRSRIGRIDGAGAFAFELDFATPGLGGEFMAGSTWLFQAAFRDAVGAGFDTTHAIAIAYRP